MAIAEVEIYRSAKLLIDQHGEDADLHASMRADELLEAGDIEGQKTWLRIVDAIDELQRAGVTRVVH